MKPARIICIAAILAAATVVLGQNADPNSAGPTKNDYRIRVIEPAEGAMIAGPTVRVVVNIGTKPEPGAGNRKDTDTMPKPSIQVFLDSQPKGTVNEPDNVVTIENVSPGSHKLAVVATNRSGEVIDRKEVSFSSTEATSTASTYSSSSSSTSSAPSSSYSAPAPPPANPPASSYSAPANPPTKSYSSTERTETTSSRTLPKTGSPAPLLAAAGLGLLALGLAARPKF